MAGDLSHPRSRGRNETLEKLTETIWMRSTRRGLCTITSEKLAISFAVLTSSNKDTVIRIYKNLRASGDCHSWVKFVTKVIERDNRSGRP
ncbi:hypothetical protein DVH24_014483 [Malus domestica]|uniref:DYW domain-containing protein n=1 Tax=Malus domestica TaxID=3750 RepID=A0A498KKA9_MALDO|nr:hypothetical protein DVH24_014483 [Malus domestica]